MLCLYNVCSIFKKINVYCYVIRSSVLLGFTPSTEGEVNINLVCRVKTKMAPLTVNVKANVFALTASVLCEDSHQNKVVLTANGINTINFGEVCK